MATRRLEKLYSKTGKEQVTEWIIQIVDIEDDLFTEFRVEMYSGLFGRALNNKPDSFLVKTGKNIGKSNETTPLEQAINEAKAKWQHKIDREGYISLKQKGLTDEQRQKITKNEIYALLPKHKAFVDGYFKPQKAYNIKDVDVIMIYINHYDKFADIKETYIVKYMEGCGVQESPFITKEIVFQSNDINECDKYIKEKYPYEEWQFKHGIIVVNTATQEGKKLYENHEKIFNHKLREINKDKKTNPQDYKTYDFEGGKITLKHNDLLDGTRKINR